MTDFNEATADADAVAVRAGRRGVTYTDVHDWVTFSSVTPEAKALYVILRAHVNRQRADDLVWTSTLALAKVMTYSRGDKITKFIRELEEIDAIKVDRNNVHGRMVFIVNQEPPTGYDGPLAAGDWHKRNKEVLDRIRVEEKSKRDARRTRAKSVKQNGSSQAVHPKRGEQPVHPKRGDVPAPKRGDERPPVWGREPDVLEPDEENQENPPADAVGGGDANPAPVQTTIFGAEEPLAPKEPTFEDKAHQIARVWIEYWANPKRNTPISGEHIQSRMAKAVIGALKAGYSDEEVGKALNAIGAPVIPTADRMQRALAEVRGHRAPTQGRRGAGARVTEHWDRVAPVSSAPAGTNDSTTVAPKRAAEIQTTGAFW